MVDTTISNYSALQYAAFGQEQTSGSAVYDGRNQAKADIMTESIESDPIDSID